MGICQPSPLNQKHNVGWFLLERFVDLFRVCYVISRNHFCWLTCRKQKLVQSKRLEQGLFLLISDFWQFRQSNFSWGKSNLLSFIKKIDMEEGFALMNLSKCKRWRVSLHGVIVKQQSKRYRHIPCLHSGKVCKGGEH